MAFSCFHPAEHLQNIVRARLHFACAGTSEDQMVWKGWRRKDDCLVIQVKVNTTSELAGRGENVDVGKILLGKMLPKVDLNSVEMLKTQFV